MLTDPIADFLTRLRNGLLAKKSFVIANCSNMSDRIANILLKFGYIDGIEYEEEGCKKYLKIKLRYDSLGNPIARGFKRVSKPGLRAYAAADEIPSVQDGLGLAIVSTSQGVITGQEAAKRKIGGEVLCLVW
jgi:small subunit ribosomal protein S8